MPFPETERVIFDKNPLEKVICQLQFLPLLKIDKEIPADFQEEIKSEFPGYENVLELQMKFDFAPGQPFSSVKQQPIESKNHQFISADGNWQVNLVHNFLALSTSKYTRWDDFEIKLNCVLQAFNKIYGIEIFSRVGLRYIDVVRKSTFGFENSRWEDLINPHFLGMMTSELEVDTFFVETKNEMNLDEFNNKVRILTSLTSEEKSEESFFKIDSDFYTNEKTTINEVINVLDIYRINSSRLIQWAISEKLYNAMEPQRI